jgi:Pvc16 N-terminal domain
VIQHVDRALEQLFRRSEALADSTIEFSFDAPDRTWGAARTRPTVNVYLWEVARNPAYQRSGMQQRVGDDGAVQRRPAMPVVDLHYLVTAWATEQGDEHHLLGSLIEVILATPRLPDAVLPEPLKGARCGLALAPYEKRIPGEFWSALDGRLKPGLQVEINLPFEVFAWKDTAPPAESVGVGVGRLPAPPSPAAGGQPPEKQFRRRRANGALLMEGRRDVPTER